MLARRTKPPTSREELEAILGSDEPILDEVASLMMRLRDGDTSDIEDDPEDIPGVDSHTVAADTHSADLPQAIQRVLASVDRQELISVAEFMLTRRKMTLIFHTSQGDARVGVDWCSARPGDIERWDALVLVKVVAGITSFAPNPGSTLDISFEGFNGRTKVIALAPPQRLYTGVDVLCFLPHSQVMEKQGVVKQGTPSVVSNLPSVGTDEAGEPVAAGEKSASASRREKPITEDFDRPREDRV